MKIRAVPAIVRPVVDPPIHRYVTPDWRAPLDVEAFLAAVPEGITVKGMFYTRLMDELERFGFKRGPEKYSAYRDYPMEGMLALELDAAKKLYPEEPIRNALRKLGWIAYASFAESMVGRMVFGVLDNNPAAIVRVAGKGYKYSMSRGRAETIESSDSHAIIRIVDVWNFSDCYQVGVIEGGLNHMGYECEMKLYTESPTDVYVRFEWHKRD